jgi:hypothetical protein
MAMTSPREHRDRALASELAALRAALRDVHAPAEGEVALRAALWARRQGRAPAPRAARRVRVSAALAAAAAVATAAVLGLLMLRAGPEDSATAVAPSAIVALPAGANGSSAAAAFQPLAFTPPLSASQSYSIVRVRIPLAALAPGNMVSPATTIEADLLVGEDGLARGIRFDKADTLLVAARSE